MRQPPTFCCTVTPVAVVTPVTNSDVMPTPSLDVTVTASPPDDDGRHESDTAQCHVMASRYVVVASRDQLRVYGHDVTAASTTEFSACQPLGDVEMTCDSSIQCFVCIDDVVANSTSTSGNNNNY